MKPLTSNGLVVDSYGIVINHPETYRNIASKIAEGGSILIAWTDEDSTQFDILFSCLDVPYKLIGQVQGGVRWNDLFVSIMRMGSFGFEIKEDIDTGSGYYEEKLGSAMGSTAKKLAELINGVRKEVYLRRHVS